MAAQGAIRVSSGEFLAMIETDVSTIVAIPYAERRSLLWLVTALRGTYQQLTSDICFVDLPADGNDGSADGHRLVLSSPGTDGPPALAFDHPWLQRLLL